MTAVVLLHAFPLDHRLWDGVVDSIATAGWEVFTPDLRGCGDAPEWDGLTPSLTQCAEDVISLLDKYGIEKAIVGGCSIGGYITMELLRIAPERVAAAIFIDTKASADNDEARANRLRVADSVIASESVEAFTRAMLPNLIGQTSQTSRPDVVAAVNLMLSQSRPAGVAALQRAMAARPDSQAAIASFYGPVLSIRGLEDTVTSADDHAQIVSAARDGVHCDIAASGHLSPLEAPAETAAAIIEFLEQIRHGSC